MSHVEEGSDVEECAVVAEGEGEVVEASEVAGPSVVGAGEGDGPSSSSGEEVVARPRTHTKSGRNVKFSYAENLALVHAIMRYHSQLFGDEAAKVSARQKSAMWRKVVAEVNAAGVVKRSEENCRKRYYDIRRLVKAKMAREAKSARRTGGGRPYVATFLDYEQPIRMTFPHEVVQATYVQDTDRPRKPAPTRSQTPPPSDATFAVGDDGAVAGPSSARTPPPKLRRQAPERPVHVTPPQQRMAEVASKPPSQLLATPSTMSPRSPHLPDEPLPPSSSLTQRTEPEDSFILNLTAIPHPEAGTADQDTQALLRTPTPQGTPTAAVFRSPTSPQPAQADNFWASWQVLQQQTMAALDTQNRHLHTVSAHMPRISRNLSRLTTELAQMNRNLELTRLENTRILEAIQQQNTTLIRHHQAYSASQQITQAILTNNMQGQTSAMRKISLILTHLTQLIQGQGQPSASTSTSVTPHQSPQTSPQRRSRHQVRGKTPAKPSGRPAKRK